MFWFILFVILMYLLLDQARTQAMDDGGERAAQIEYRKYQQEINRINEKYKLKDKNWQDEVSFRYSKEKNCVDIKMYGLLLKQLKGIDGLILESYYIERSGQVIFILYNSVGTQIRHIVNEERLMELPNHVGQYEFMEELIDKWFNKQKELERNPYYDILDRMENL